MIVELSLEEWGALTSARDDGAPPKEGPFPRAVYERLTARGFMRHRVGKLPDGAAADFYLTTPAGETALKNCRVVP